MQISSCRLIASLKYPVRVDHDVMVPMRDGVLLATDVYRPIIGDQVQSAALPVIMERTPYGKQSVSRSERSRADPRPATRAEVATFFARQGYVVVMQDCRGRYGSGGVFEKYVNEAEDGLDTITWLLAQPWCNGKVGTMGLSYGAHTQCALACLNPPGIACMFIDSGGFSSAYHGGIRRGGAFELKQATWAYRHALLSPATAADPSREAALKSRDITEWFRDMPWQPGHSPLQAAPEYEAYLFRQWREGLFSDYWKQPGLYLQGYYDAFPDVPTAIIGSWYDPYVLTCISNFIGLSARKRSLITLLMGPWTHGDRSLSFAGDVDFGPQSTLDGNIAADYRALRLAWFDRWLKNEAEVPPSPPDPVTYFQMGGGPGRRDQAGRLQHGGRWRRAASWPPAGVVTQHLYLHKDGKLKYEAPRADHEFLQYLFDPEDPMPTIGGALTSGDPLMAGGAFDQRESEGVFTYSGALSDAPLSERPDVLVFETEPLEDDVIVTGAMAAELWISSNKPDTDFTVKLIDVYPPGNDYPQGFAMNITDGIFRVRYREGWEQEVLMSPGQVYPIRIEPFATSNLFKAGHRLRIDISSSNYPHFDINPNTGAPVGYAGAFEVAVNRVYCCAQYPSRILLPVMRASA